MNTGSPASTRRAPALGLATCSVTVSGSSTDDMPPRKDSLWRLLISSSSGPARSEEHTSELQSRGHLVCRLLLEKKKKIRNNEKQRINITLMKHTPTSLH